MKKVIVLATAIFFCGINVFAASQPVSVSDTSKVKTTKPGKVQYTCTMHPDVLTDKPGKCPKCGMTLVKKETAKKAPAMKM
ncbi:MAG: heavy metal-binding domain-containing protein [Mucilaginibacter sp.]